jgi:hypothetical protein
MGGNVAHPKLATVINRSLLAASTAALVAGPLAAAGLAQSLDVTEGVTSAVELTCDEALETEDIALIAEFCEPDEVPAPLAEATEEARAALDAAEEETTATAEKVTATVSDEAPTDDGGSGGGGDSDPDSSPTGSLLPSSPTSPTGPTAPTADDPTGSSPDRSRKVRNSGENIRGFDGASHGESAKTNASYGAGPGYGGMRSNSSLTLQPFEAPVFSVPPVYELPQVAQQLFGLDSTATDPAAAGAMDATAMSATSSSSATPADPTGWLAATATGLIMLMGAAHALNGARTPQRRRA